MDIIQAVTLALLQGFTEFLPISSSAHLILVPVITGWKDQGLAFDVAVHIGTLTAVTAYYRRDLRIILCAWWGSVTGKGLSDDAKLAWYVCLGTVPVGLVGILLPKSVEYSLRSPLVIAAATIVFALLLWVVEKNAQEQRSQISMSDAIVVGLFQAIALIPGTSRSGITITAGLMKGLRRDQAARFSFLLSIPVIALAGMLSLVELIKSQDPVPWNYMAVGTMVSGVVAFLSIGWFLKLLENIGMMPFVYYRLILGIVLFAIFLG